MNAFDKNILLFLNGFVDRWPHFDVFIGICQNNPLFKGAFFIAALWGLWFSRKEAETDTRARHEIIFGSICALTIGIFVARLMANLLPFRVRPFANSEITWRLPEDINHSGLATWSAFPSDHAVVWFAMVAGIFALNRSLGFLALFYAAFLAFGRVYLGIHHPTDILAGAAIGVGLSVFFHSPRVREKIYAPMWILEQRRPGIFYAGAFLITYEIATMFDHVRPLVMTALRLLRSHILS
jgi:undecaprenyl-diphosphatase